MRKLLMMLSLVLAVSLLAMGGAMAVDISVPDDDALYAAYTYILDNVSYQLPTSIRDLEANGWRLTSIDGDVSESDMLDGMTYSIYNSLEKGDAKISVYTLNPTREKRAMRDCYISRLSIDGRSYNTGELNATALFSLPSGLAVGSTVADLKAYYGVELVYMEDPDGVTMTSCWDGSEAWYGGESYYLMKDGQFFSYAGDSNVWDQVGFRYKVVGDSSTPRLHNNTSELGQNDLTIFFDGPLSDDNAKINLIQIELEYAPSPNAPAAPASAESEPANEAESWTCENGHEGNTGNFCTECGAPKPTQKTACDACGYAFDGEVPKFCPNCGAAQG